MIIAIIQARMGSTRLPNKVMQNILNKPIIEHLLENVSKSKLIDKIIIATTTNKQDDELVAHIKSLGYDIFRGSENDVLKRYYDTFQSIPNNDKIKGIVRLTGDCPLLQADIIDTVIQEFINTDIDYVALSENFAEGLDTEIFTPKMLEDAHFNANLESQREHVCQYFHKHIDKYPQKRIQNNTDDSMYRITVDEAEDFEVIKEIIEYFNISNKELNIKNIKIFLDENNDIYSLNSKIMRNEGLKISLKNDKVLV